MHSVSKVAEMKDIINPDSVSYRDLDVDKIDKYDIVPSEINGWFIQVNEFKDGEVYKHIILSDGITSLNSLVPSDRMAVNTRSKACLIIKDVEFPTRTNIVHVHNNCFTSPIFIEILRSMLIDKLLDADSDITNTIVVHTNTKAYCVTVDIPTRNSYITYLEITKLVSKLRQSILQKITNRMYVNNYSASHIHALLDKHVYLKISKKLEYINLTKYDIDNVEAEIKYEIDKSIVEEKPEVIPYSKLKTDTYDNLSVDIRTVLKMSISEFTQKFKTKKDMFNYALEYLENTLGKVIDPNELKVYVRILKSAQNEHVNRTRSQKKRMGKVIRHYENQVKLTYMVTPDNYVGNVRKAVVEHVRSGHWRHYKNKKVWIKTMTVAKDIKPN